LYDEPYSFLERSLQLDGPILVIIDALGESGLENGKAGLHTFLAQCVIDLSPNFYVLIISRPENGIEPAFANATSVFTLYTDDVQLAANMERDIGLYLRRGCITALLVLALARESAYNAYWTPYTKEYFKIHEAQMYSSMLLGSFLLRSSRSRLVR
jgi:hypothetical protein